MRNPSNMLFSSPMSKAATSKMSTHTVEPVLYIQRNYYLKFVKVDTICEVSGVRLVSGMTPLDYMSVSNMVSVSDQHPKDTHHTVS